MLHIDVEARDLLTYDKGHYSCGATLCEQKGAALVLLCSYLFWVVSVYIWHCRRLQVLGCSI